MPRTLFPEHLINQQTSIGGFNEAMANLDPSFNAQAPHRVRRVSASRRWSSRRTVTVALLVSGTLWAAIYYAAKALIA